MGVFNLKKEQIAKAIADVVHWDWDPNGHRAEGYSIMVAYKGDGFYFNNIMVERLRMRLNTLDRIFNPDHKPFVLWRVKNYNDGIELRFIYGDESAFNYRECESVRLYDDSDDKPHDGTMSFAAYLFYVAYTAGIGHKREGHAFEGNDAVTDIANDFVYEDGNAQYIFDGQQLYDYIYIRACKEAEAALNKAVKDYHNYCSENGLKGEAININESKKSWRRQTGSTTTSASVRRE